MPRMFGAGGCGASAGGGGDEAVQAVCSVHTHHGCLATSKSQFPRLTTLRLDLLLTELPL